MTTREQLLAAPKRLYQEVETPVGTFTLQSLLSKEKADNEMMRLNRKGEVDIPGLVRSKYDLVTKMLVDSETKERMFADNEVHLIEGLGSHVVEPLFAAALKINGGDEEDVEELVKNSDTTGG